MKRLILSAAILGISVLQAPHALAESPIRANLTLPHNDVLPGVPFDLVVTYTNVSERPVVIKGATATLVLLLETGPAVVLNEPDVNDQWFIGDELPMTVAPGESVQQAASWESGSIPNWFHYDGSTLSGPGTYRIALDLRVVDDEERLLVTLRTPAVTLRRVEPVGVDAELWRRMQEVAGGKWADGSFTTTREGELLAKEIVQIHPGSGYYPYVLALRSFDSGVRDPNSLPLLLEAEDRFRDSPAYPYLLTAAGHCANYRGLEAQMAGQEAEAEKYLRLAEKKYREAWATQSVSVRKSTNFSLRSLERRVAKQPR